MTSNTPQQPKKKHAPNREQEQAAETQMRQNRERQQDREPDNTRHQGGGMRHKRSDQGG